MIMTNKNGPVRQHAPRGNKDPAKKAQRDAAKVAASRPGADSTRYVLSMRAPSMRIHPEDAALVRYTAALVNPFDVDGVGIPYGSPLPTFKQQCYFSTQRIATAGAVAPVAEFSALSSPFVIADLQMSSTSLTFNVATSAVASSAVRTYTIASGRLVSAAIRVVYVGRADDFGGTCIELLRTADGITAKHRPLERQLVARYHPQTNFDLDFKDSGTTNLNFVSGISVGVNPAAAGGAFMIQFVANVETNSEVPITPSYVDGNYVTLTHEATPSAGHRLENAMPAITALVKTSPDTKREGHHDEATVSHGKGRDPAILSAAKHLEKHAVIAAGVANHVSGAITAMHAVGTAAALLM